MLGYDPERVEVLLYQLVHLTSGGEQKKMSKRRGDVVFLDEFIDEIGVDVPVEGVPMEGAGSAGTAPSASSAPPRGGSELHPEPRQALRFPLGLAVSTERLYIADSGHHRILECSHGGRILRQFGLGTADFMDGNLAEAAFHRPQALVLERQRRRLAGEHPDRGARPAHP